MSFTFNTAVSRTVGACLLLLTVSAACGGDAVSQSDPTTSQPTIPSGQSTDVLSAQPLLASSGATDGQEVTNAQAVGVPSSGVPPSTAPESLAPSFPVHTSTTYQNQEARTWSEPVGYRAPDRDLAELAVRLRGVEVSDTSGPSTAPLETGTREEFWLTDADDDSARRITATLRHRSEHAYWFVDDEAEVDLAALEESAGLFEERVRPAIVEAFGDIATPGIDGDPRLFVLHSVLERAAGYYGSKDAFPSEVHPFSNEREIIYIDVRTLRLGSDIYMSVVAHEFQHAVHFHADVGEESWVNEGLSELATEAAGYVSQFTRFFLRRPNTQLNYWPDGSHNTPAHYGASNLFFAYLAQGVGGLAGISDLVEGPQDGIEGVEAFLEGRGLSFEDVFADWVVANYLDADSPRHGYTDRDIRIATVRTLSPGSGRPDTVPQFSSRYYRIDSSVPTGTLTFHGDSIVRGVRQECESGPTCWWSGRGDEIDTTLTREFDLTGLGEATLEYRVWHEIEDGWDYGYIQVSVDGGSTWHILEGEHTSDDNPSGNAYGPGYTGLSHGWKQESIDLSEFAGGAVLVRFEYVTDDAVYLDGMLIDGIAIAELDFVDDEDQVREWDAAGFVRAGDLRAQSFTVQVLQIASDGGYSIIRLPLDGLNYSRAALSNLSDGLETIVIVSPTARGTRHSPSYTLRFEEVR